MTTYDEKSMVNKQDAQFIAKALSDMGSKVPSDIEESLENNNKEEYALGNLLGLACRDSSSKLEASQISSIKNDQFSIKKSAINKLCEMYSIR